MKSLMPTTDFPLLSDSSMIYLDAATMTPVPVSVVEAMNEYYHGVGGIPNRGAHRVSIASSEQQFRARDEISAFFGVPSSSIAFVPSITHAATVAAYLHPIAKGQGVLLSPYLHHASLVPWIRRTNRGLIQRFYPPFTLTGRTELSDISTLIAMNPKVAVLPFVSPVTGVITPLETIIPVLHDNGIPVIVDGTHAVGHFPIDLNALKCDVFYCSGNIGLMGPIGLGVLYINPNADLPAEPLFVGDGAVQAVSLESYSLLGAPTRYESGVSDTASQMGLVAAIDYLKTFSLDRIQHNEQALLNHLLQVVPETPKLSLYGDLSDKNRVGILSFNFDNLNPHDVAMILDESSNIQIGSGMLCAHPAVQHLDKEGVVRLSIHGYNNLEQLEFLEEKLRVISTDLT